MTCIIIEDEQPAQQILLNYIERTPYLQCLGAFDSAMKVPFDLLNNVDVLFLDIQLPEITGIDFLKSMKYTAKTIITTAYRDYAIDAFEIPVNDYLLKPISYPRFLKAVLRVQDLLKTEKEETEELFIYMDKVFHKINKNDIDYIQAQIDYVQIMTNGKKLLVQDSLNNWETKLKDNHFVRVHRSFIVNTKKIEQVQGNQLLIKNTLIPIGKTYRNDLFQKINLV
jgi:two-component system, LytTR family, response regulator LytT